MGSARASSRSRSAAAVIPGSAASSRAAKPASPIAAICVASSGLALSGRSTTTPTSDPTSPAQRAAPAWSTAPAASTFGAEASTVMPRPPWIAVRTSRWGACRALPWTTAQSAAALSDAVPASSTAILAGVRLTKANAAAALLGSASRIRTGISRTLGATCSSARAAVVPASGGARRAGGLTRSKGRAS